MKKVLFALVALYAVSAKAEFLELNDAKEFEALVATSTVPVIVQFAASWCGPCQSLRRVFETVSEDYTDNQVKLAYVDADENSSLQKYLQGGYPTVRTFRSGKLGKEGFAGSKSESYLRTFITGVINANSDKLFCPLE